MTNTAKKARPVAGAAKSVAAKAAKPSGSAAKSPARKASKAAAKELPAPYAGPDGRERTIMKNRRIGSKEGRGGDALSQMNGSPDTDDPIYWASVFRMIAANFRRSAEAVLPNLECRDDGSPAKLTALPFYFLVSHAIELFLKSALLKRGYVPADLRRFDNRHNLKALLELLKKKGLPVSTEATSIIEGLSSQHSNHLLRYHFLINPFMPPPDSLWPILDELLMLTRTSTHGR